MTIVTICLAVLIGIAGVAKLAGAKSLADQFHEFGLPKTMMYLVGSLEVAAAIGLNFNLLRFYASCGLVLLMLGAVGNHVKVKHPFTQMAPSLVVLLLAGIVASGAWSTAGLVWDTLGL